MREPCFATFNGRIVELYDADKIRLRIFNMPHNVVGAQVGGSGNDTRVSIMMDDGSWENRSWDGRILLKGHR